MSNLFSLKDKIVLLTGGEGHLGSAMARGFLDFDATVLLVDLAPGALAAAIECESMRARLHNIPCDLSDPSGIRRMFRDVQETFGRVDVLVNNAAYGGGSGGRGSVTAPERIDDEQWLSGIDGTLNVTFRCIREAIPCMGGGGSIVNIASMYGLVSPDPRIYGDSGNNSPPSYGAGKAAVIQLTRYFAGCLAGRGIRVNSITPGPFPNPKVRQNTDFLAKLEAKTMLGRVGTPAELLGAAVLLASGASSFMTGSNIVVDGGWTAW